MGYFLECTVLQVQADRQGAGGEGEGLHLLGRVAPPGGGAGPRALEGDGPERLCQGGCQH